MLLRIAGLGVLCLGLTVAACGDDITPPEAPPAAADVTPAVSGAIPEQVFARLTGGGHIREGEWDLSFAGVVRALASDWAYVEWADADSWTTLEPGGEWVMQIHRVPDAGLSGRTFRSTGFLDATFAVKRSPLPACVSRAYFTVEGTLDGEPGWIAWVVVADVGHRAPPGAADSFRMALWPPGAHPDAALKAMDTSWDFTPDATCLGGAKREMAGGNLRIFVGY